MRKLGFILCCFLIFSTKLFAECSPETSPNIGYKIAQEGNLIVEIQQNQCRRLLLYRVGRVEGDRIEWGKTSVLHQGILPALAIAGNQVILMHESFNDCCKLWSHLGQLDPDNLMIKWGESKAFHDGRYAALATDGYRLFATYNSKYTRRLYYQTGILDIEKQSISPQESGSSYEIGRFPSIAKAGNMIIEVHQGESLETLWYKIATIQGEDIVWGKTHRYDSGVYPSIAVNGNTIVEVHMNDSDYPDKIWYHIGTINPDTKTITWGSSRFISKGYNPQVSLNGSNVIVSYISNRMPVYKMGMISPGSRRITWA